MPGIAGIINPVSKEDGTFTIRLMLAAMQHEQFHTMGMLGDTELNLVAGWVSHKGSYAESVNTGGSNEPMCKLVFSGEVFAETHSAETALSRNDNRDIVRAYIRGGEPSLAELNGLFSGLIVDLSRRVVHLFNDRYGIERIYIAQHQGATYFASEAKALLRVLPHLRSYDEQGVGQFLAYGCTFGEQTIFRGISLLPAASCWTLSPDLKWQKSAYFSPSKWEEQESLTETEFESKFFDLFPRILPRYLATRDTLGVSLTGGLDTRMIMACLARSTARPRCYTFSGQQEKTLDAELAALIASRCGLEHFVLRIGNDFIRDFFSISDRTVYISDGCCSVTGSHEIYFNAAARSLSPIRLTGNFGSEILRSMSTFKPSLLAPQLFSASIRGAIHSAGLNRSAPVHPVSFAAFQEIPWNLIGTLLAGRSQVTFRTPYLDNDLVALAYRAPSSCRTSALSALRFIAAVNPALAAIPTDRGHIGSERGLLWLTRRIRAELTFKLDYLHKEGLPSWLSPFDPVLDSLTHTGLLGRHKFLPYRKWFRNELSPGVREILTDNRTRELPFFNPDFFEPMLLAHSRGRKNYVREINAVLTLEAINRLLIEKPF